MPGTDELIRNMLREHLELGAHKPVSYLPIKTVERVLGLSVTEYMDMARVLGHSSLSFLPDQCCIKSGAVYIYSPKELKMALDREAETLSKENFPSAPPEFIAAIAREWFVDDHPIMFIIRKVFGEN